MTIAELNTLLQTYNCFACLTPQQAGQTTTLLLCQGVTGVVDGVGGEGGDVIGGEGGDIVGPE